MEIALSAIMTDAALAYRDYATDGLPVSGAHEPQKPDIRTLFAKIDTALSAIGFGGSVGLSKDTRANLNADLAHAAGVVAVVYADSTPDNNDLYMKVGSSGTGSWTKLGLTIPASLADDIADLVASYALIITKAAETATNATAAAASALAAASSASTTLALSVAVQANKTASEAAADLASAAADATGPAKFYDTYSAANGDLASIAANATVEIAADETHGGQRARYRKESGALVFKLLLPSMRSVTKRQRSLWYNYTSASMGALRTALAGTRTNGYRTRVACIGDSETMGLQAAGAGYTDGRVGSYPTRLALLLNDAIATGPRFTYDNVFGDGNATDYEDYNPRVVMASGWGVSGGTTVGAHYFTNTTTTGAWAYYCGTGYTDQGFIWYVDVSPMVMTVDIGGSTLATITGTGTNTIKGVAVSWTRAQNVNLNVKRVSGTASLIGVEVFDDTVGSVSILNMGWSGAKSDEWTRDDYAPDPNYPGNYETLDLDAALVMLGVNDGQNDVPVATFKANMKLLVQRLRTAGTSVLLVSPIPYSIAIKSLAHQQSYVDALYAVSDEENVPLYDMFQRFGSYELASAAGLYADATHPNGLGYMDVAMPLAEPIANP